MLNPSSSYLRQACAIAIVQHSTLQYAACCLLCTLIMLYSGLAPHHLHSLCVVSRPGDED